MSEVPLRSRVSGSGFRVSSLGLMVYGVWFRVECEFRAPSLGLSVGFGFRVSGSGFRVQGVGEI